MDQLSLKSPEEIEIMKEGGRKLSRVKRELSKSIKEGVNALEIENLATKLIREEGCVPSFKMVPGYNWSTCININEGIVHGIPKKEIVFKNKDVVSIDVGIYFKGFHTDSAVSIGINPDNETTRFLETGKRALNRAVKSAKAGNRVYDISKSIQDVVVKEGYAPIRALVGHGVGTSLHENPQIPCFVSGERDQSPLLSEGMTLAIEVMYTAGLPAVKILPDGWTIVTVDGKISALFEETIAVEKSGPVSITT